MNTTKNRKAAFTLVEIMIVVAIIGLLAAIAIPNFVKARETAQSNACINNMRQIDSAIQQWALESKSAPDAGIDDTAKTQIAEYIKGKKMPTCPAGEKAYIIGGTVQEPSIACPNEKPNGSHKMPAFD